MYERFNASSLTTTRNLALLTFPVLLLRTLDVVQLIPLFLPLIHIDVNVEVLASDLLVEPTRSNTIHRFKPLASNFSLEGIGVDDERFVGAKNENDREAVLFVVR